MRCKYLERSENESIDNALVIPNVKIFTIAAPCQRRHGWPSVVEYGAKHFWFFVSVNFQLDDIHSARTNISHSTAQIAAGYVNIEYAQRYLKFKEHVLGFQLSIRLKKQCKGVYQKLSIRLNKQCKGMCQKLSKRLQKNSAREYAYTNGHLFFWLEFKSIACWWNAAYNKRKLLTQLRMPEHHHSLDKKPVGISNHPEMIYHIITWYRIYVPDMALKSSSI